MEHIVTKLNVTDTLRPNVGKQPNISEERRPQLTSLGISEAMYAWFNPLSAELNPICYLPALLPHHFLHVSKIRVKSLTLRLLM
jgi:hypothetical protein